MSAELLPGWFSSLLPPQRAATTTLVSIFTARSLSQTPLFLSLPLFVSQNRTIEVRLDDIEQDTQCAVCLGKFRFFSFFFQLTKLR